MKKILIAILITGTLLAGQALAVLTPSSSVVSPMIKDAAREGGDYYYLFVPDTDTTPRVRVHRISQDGTATADVATITLSNLPYGIAVSSDSKKLYVSLSGSGSSVNVYDIENNFEQVASLKPNKINAPRQIALSSDDKYLFVADELSGYIHIIDTITLAPISDSDGINVGETGLYGLAVQQDGSRLAVSNRTENKVIIYDISAVSQGTIPTTPAYEIQNLIDPTYLKYAIHPGSLLEKLYVRVHETSGDYADVRVFVAYEKFDLSNPVYYPSAGYVSIVAAADEDPSNQWEGMDVSPDGLFLYVTHYRDLAGTVNDGLYSYTFKADKLATPSDAILFANAEAAGDAWKVKGPMLSSKDSVVLAPNGGRLWFTYSYGGSHDSSTTGTGYTDGSGKIINSPPGKATITYPTDGAKDVAGDATWTAAWDENQSTLVYDVYYAKNAVIGLTWIELATGVSGLKTAMDSTKMLPGGVYHLKLRAKDEKGAYGEFVGVGPFTMKDGTTPPTPGATAIIDDFEGSNTYDAFGAGVTVPTLKTGSYNNTKMGETTYSFVSGFGGGWGGNLPSTLDIEKSSDGKITFDRIRYHIKGDGSDNTYHISIKVEASGKEYRSPGPSKNLTGTAWETIDVLYSEMWYDANQNGTKDAAETDTFDNETDKKIKRYNVVYTGKDTSTTTHNIDDIEAVSGTTVIGDKKILSFNADKSNKHWLSIPYDNKFLKINGVSENINGGIAADYITAVTRLNPLTQKKESWIYNALLGWIPVGVTGTDSPAYVNGEAVEIIIKQETTVDLAKLGSPDTTFKFDLKKNTTGTNKHWVSVPYKTPNLDIQKVVDEINGGTTATNSSAITRLNPSTQKKESRLNNALLGWLNVPSTLTKTPPVIVAEGYEIIILKDTTWTPKVK